MWKIYKHVFPNGKIYIGQTKQRLTKRFGHGAGYAFCPLMAKAIDKYGWDSIVTEILENNITSQELANEREIYYIKLYDSRNPDKGYNIGYGGGVVDRCEDERILTLWNEGKSQTEIKSLLHYDMQTIRLFLEAHGVNEEMRYERRNQIISNKSKYFDNEQIYQLWQEHNSYPEIIKQLGCSRDTIRRALEQKGITEEQRRENGKLMSADNKTCQKPVNQYDLNNNYIQTFKSIAAANIALGKISNSSNIVQVCKGKRKQAYGFVWRYTDS